MIRFSIFLLYFEKRDYGNGDVIWVSKLTGKGVAGWTHDGWFWNSIDDKIKRYVPPEWSIDHIGTEIHSSEHIIGTTEKGF